MSIYLKLILVKLRLLLLVRFAPDMRAEIEEEIADSDKDFFKEILKEKGGAISSKTLEALLEAERNIKHAFVKTLPLEVALVNLLGKE